MHKWKWHQYVYHSQNFIDMYACKYTEVGNRMQYAPLQYIKKQIHDYFLVCCANYFQNFL